ncbi:MAG: protein rep [Treponema sp.]|nr:protein rep [Treponema sp.]
MIKSNDKSIKNVKKKQEKVFLSDKDTNGKERPWAAKKTMNEALRGTYLSLAMDENLLGLPDYYLKRAERLNFCSRYLEFKNFEDGTRKLNRACFCQLTLCPICSWRKELKVRVQLGKVVTELIKQGYRFLFLTLTCENVGKVDLSDTVDNLYSSFDKMFKLRPVGKAIDGHFRALEITHDTKRKITKAMYKRSKEYYDTRNLKVGDVNPNFNMYHPHFHVMLAVKPSYFKEKDLYIKQEEWTSHWQQSLQVSYKPIVDVRAIRDVKGKGVLEVAKYTVKDKDYIVKEDRQLSEEVVMTLDDVLYRRRLIGYGGIMRKIHKALNLDEDVKADVNIDEEDEEYKEVSHIIERYNWHVGFKNYVLKSAKKVTAD